MAVPPFYTLALAHTRTHRCLKSLNHSAMTKPYLLCEPRAGTNARHGLQLFSSSSKKQYYLFCPNLFLWHLTFSCHVIRIFL